MSRARALYGSLLGQKLVMAVTGILLYLFLIGHLLGNLQIFSGRDKLNGYAAFLQGTGEILWATRSILLLALFLHIIAAVRLTIANWQARPVAYALKRDIQTSYAARTMIVSGPLILLYAIYHLMMFTFLATGPGYSETDVYRNVVQAFQQPAISAVYILAMLILAYHLWHAGWSMLQTLGITYPGIVSLRWRLFPIVSVLIALGYITIPVAVLLGVVR
jgi:succinate dehydrogenase / fumarate reductase cytochrome b subunit